MVFCRSVTDSESGEKISDQAANATTVRPNASAAVRATAIPPLPETTTAAAALGREELEAAAFPLPLEPLLPLVPAAVGAVAAPVLAV